MDATTMQTVTRYLKEDEAAAILQIHEQTLKRERLNGLIDYHKIAGGQVRYTIEQIDDYVRNHPQNSKRVKRVVES